MEISFEEAAEGQSALIVTAKNGGTALMCVPSHLWNVVSGNLVVRRGGVRITGGDVHVDLVRRYVGFADTEDAYFLIAPGEQKIWYVDLGPLALSVGAYSFGVAGAYFDCSHLLKSIRRKSDSPVGVYMLSAGGDFVVR